ncbi:MAG TPA: FAD-binding oxidoreductase [Ktedonobacteraceae bacterium]
MTETPTCSAHHPDVLIIGGGVLGCSVAYHLALRGCSRVTLVERDTLASGTTAKGAGGVRQQFSDETNIALSRYSVQFFEQLQEHLALPKQSFQQVGYLFLLRTTEELASYQAGVDLQRRMGVPAQLLSPQEIQAVCPGLYVDDLLGATFCASDGYSSPPQVARAFARKARQLGVQILEGVEVLALQKSGDRIDAVETSAGTFHPGNVVCCAGAWSGEIGKMSGVNIPIQPLPRMCFRSAPLPTLPSHLPMVIDVHNSFYFRPDGDARFLLSMNSPEAYSFAMTVDWAWSETVLVEARRRVPAFSQLVIEEGWSGLYEDSPDHNAILGPVPEIPNLLIAAGFSGHGFMQSPAAGLALSECILDGSSHTLDISAFSIERFASGQLRAERNII